MTNKRYIGTIRLFPIYLMGKPRGLCASSFTKIALKLTDWFKRRTDGHGSFGPCDSY